jgi:LVIVD repeat
MMRRSSVRLAVALLLVLVTPLVVHAPPVGSDEGDQHSDNMSLLFNAPNSTGATNTDLSFWGDLAYAGNYSGFRIFDISDPAAPEQLSDVVCFGPQGDTVVWENELLFVTVDTTLTGPECGSPAAPTSDDPNGWEGVRIFDVSDPTAPRYIDAVYTDCGAHTITLYPQSKRELMIYVSSYPLLPGPTCGPVRGPENGNSPLHEKISVISVPVDAPEDAEVVAQPTVSYPGDPDNRWDPAEHGLVGNFNPITACHDMTVHESRGLVAAACAEQVQLWSIDRHGIPETEEPLWVYDDNVDEDGPGGGDVARDFWHTTRFTWDGRYVQADDESLGTGCPTVTPNIGDTGRTHFLSTRTGQELSNFTLDTSRAQDDTYCSVHQGNFVRTRDGRYLSVSAWYQGGVNVIDVTDPRRPREVAYYDAGPGDHVDPAVASGPQGELALELGGDDGSFGIADHPGGPTGSNNWAAYWYEGPSLPGSSLTIYGQEGFAAQPDASRGFQVYRVDLPVSERRRGHLNPQTQD